MKKNRNENPGESPKREAAPAETRSANAPERPRWKTLPPGDEAPRSGAPPCVAATPPTDTGDASDVSESPDRAVLHEKKNGAKKDVTKISNATKPLAEPLEWPATELATMGQATTPHRARKESAGWLSSFALHGMLLLVVALLLSPADYAGTAKQVLLMRFDEQVEFEPVAEIVVTEQVEAAPQEAPVEPQSSPLVAVEKPAAFKASLAHGKSDGSAPDPNRQRSGGNAGTRGSFFGLEAKGHEFVYVLDMSGSMRGRRFNRASAELIRSVKELRDTQHFYVLLFSNSTVQMFGEKSYKPKAVAATAENKAKLSRWLQSAYRGGGTDPRNALRIALRMDPSAIFMLSDGRFNGQSKQKNARLLQGNSDAFAIVAASTSKAPIHAIAFENTDSRENMQRLAELTDGQYRFAAARTTKETLNALEDVKRSFDRGETAEGEILLREIVSAMPESEMTAESAAAINAALTRWADLAFSRGDLRTTARALSTIVELDPSGERSETAQRRLLTLLLDAAKRELDSVSEKRPLTSELAAIAQAFPNSTAAGEILRSANRRYMNKATEELDSGDSLAAFRTLSQALVEFPEAKALAECRRMRETISEDLLGKTDQIASAEGNGAAARYLLELSDLSRGTKLQQLVDTKLRQLAIDMLARSRDASYTRDFQTMNAVTEELDRGFGDHVFLKRVRNDFARTETAAREVLRQADRYERSNDLEKARRQYDSIVQRYSGTLAAKKAGRRLNQMSGLGDDSQADAQEALERMLQSATQ